MPTNCSHGSTAHVKNLARLAVERDRAATNAQRYTNT
jgi:hypothetical protein